MRLCDGPLVPRTRRISTLSTFVLMHLYQCQSSFHCLLSSNCLQMLYCLLSLFSDIFCEKKKVFTPLFGGGGAPSSLSFLSRSISCLSIIFFAANYLKLASFGLHVPASLKRTKHKARANDTFNISRLLNCYA